MKPLLAFKPNKYSTKKGLNRSPGECDVLRNTTPARVEGSETTRFGYSTAGLPALPTVGGVTVSFDSTLGDRWVYVSTENPSAKEVLFLFSHISSTQYIHVYSTITAGGVAWVDGWVLINESISLTFTGVAGANDTTFAGSGSGISAVNDYYNGWMAYNSAASTNTKGVLIIDYVGSTNTFTTWENIGSGGFAWNTVSGTVVLYRNFHAEIESGLAWTAAFSNPSVSENNLDGLFRIILGKNSSLNYRPIVHGYIKNVVTNIDSNTYTWQGSYTSLRQISAPPADVFASADFYTETDDLDDNKTYHIGICAIYNGYQRSPMIFAPQASITGGTDGGFLTTGLTGQGLIVFLNHYPGTSDKRITGYELYVAQDEGDTNDNVVASTPYYFIKRFNLKVGDSAVTEWGYTSTSYLQAFFSMTQSIWESRGSSWEEMSGYIRGVDTMYSADLEISTPTRQWLSRVYGYTDGKEDLDSDYTNARNIEGLIQPDIFPDQPEVYRHRVKYGDSSVIDGILPVSQGEVLVLKDQSISKQITDELPDGGLLVRTETISERIGCVSPIHGYIKTPYGVYFVGKDDIYLYDNQGLKGLTIDDWADTYRAIAYATKQAAIVWYRPDEEAVFYKLGSDIYAFYLRYQSWRQVSYAHTFVGYTVKANGTVVWWVSAGTAYQFDTTPTDAGTAIVVTIDTGLFRIGTSEESARIHRAFFNRPQSNAVATGTMVLDYDGSSSTVTYSSIATGQRASYGIPVTTRAWSDKMKLTHVHSGVIEIENIEVDGIIVKRKKVV